VHRETLEIPSGEISRAVVVPVPESRSSEESEARLLTEDALREDNRAALHRPGGIRTIEIHGGRPLSVERALRAAAPEARIIHVAGKSRLGPRPPAADGRSETLAVFYKALPRGDLPAASGVEPPADIIVVDPPAGEWDGVRVSGNRPGGVVSVRAMPAMEYSLFRGINLNGLAVPVVTAWEFQGGVEVLAEVDKHPVVARRTEGSHPSIPRPMDRDMLFSPSRGPGAQGDPERRRMGQNILYLGFDPEKTLWPQSVTFPIFWANVLGETGRLAEGESDPFPDPGEVRVSGKTRPFVSPAPVSILGAQPARQTAGRHVAPPQIQTTFWPWITLLAAVLMAGEWVWRKDRIS
jgi:hypothetical protein